MLDMPILETARLLIRPFVMEDLPNVHRLLDIELHDAALHADKMGSMAERAAWLQWSVLNYVQLAKLYQPPYGDRAAVLKSSGQLVGICGFVPCLAPFELLPGFSPGDSSGRSGRYSPEIGLFYAISPSQRRQGYASEAAQALVDYAFEHLHIKRVVATTDHDNVASLGVMRKLGMRIEKNPRPEPSWLQVVGVVERDK
jgi:ribosomal-protein-alanine N-acetyltransferase